MYHQNFIGLTTVYVHTVLRRNIRIPPDWVDSEVGVRAFAGKEKPKY